MRSRAGAATDVERLENAGEIGGIEGQTDGLELVVLTLSFGVVG